MTQDLFYTPASSSLVLVRSTDPSPYYWYDITSVQISGSAYDATVSGSDFGGTAATARIYAYSGSTLVVSFPIEGTNLYYPPFPNPLVFKSFYKPIEYTSSFAGFDWSFIVDGYFTNDELSGSAFSVYDSGSNTYYITGSIYSDEGGSGIVGENTYNLYVSGSGSYYNAYLTLNNDTLGITLFNGSSSNSPISASFVATSSYNYSAVFSIISTYSP